MVLPTPSRYPIISVPFTVYLLKCIKMIQEEQQQAIQNKLNYTLFVTILFNFTTESKQKATSQNVRPCMVGIRHPSSLQWNLLAGH